MAEKQNGIAEIPEEDITLRQAFARLLKVKSIITLLVAAALLIGFLNGVIDGEQFMQIVVMVFTFYFARQVQD